MKVQTQYFRTRAREALLDQQLQTNLARLGVRFKGLRDLAFAQLDDAEGLREQAKAVKERSMANLPQLLETLEKRVQEAGGVVHWARTAEEARRIIGELVRGGSVRSVVKGKSMVTEEIGLNEYLTGLGVDVWETDLGEFIIQLAGEPPSHIIAPAIHKSKEEIARLFSSKLGVSEADSPEQLTEIARETLRQRFLGADMGITGANMAVAETGSIVLLENEGNIRLSTTVPRIHVVLMGIEKVIPTLEDMAILLAVLPRSATGQKLSSYVSIITGPRREGEADGPQEFHLVILDNGRSRILADPDRRQTLHCIRCGACLNVCPVYRKVGGHSYGWAYSGPIGSVLTPQLVPAKKAWILPFATTLCGACAEVCPVKIDLPKLLLTMRWRLMEDRTWDGAVPFQEKIFFFLFGWLASHPGLYSLASSVMRTVQRAIAPDGKWRVLPPPLSRWARTRRIPTFATPFSKRWPKFNRRVPSRS